MALSSLTTAERIEAVERGFLPAVVVRGRSQRTTLRERMAALRVPGVSIAVINGGRIEWAKGYGVSDAVDGGAVDERTLFQACSISKPVSALAALALVERGVLDLDEDVNARLRSWKVPENEFTRREPVTLRRILSHTAGLTVSGVPGHARRAELPSLRAFLNGEHPDCTEPVRVDMLPGSAFRYSGGGTTVMQLLLEDVTSRPFADFARETLLEPLGMARSTYEHPLADDLCATAASGHAVDGKPLDGKWTAFAATAAGGLWTTPSDLARYAIGVQEACTGRSARVISQPMAREMLRRQHRDWTYGLGPHVEGDGASLRFEHGGSNIGYRCRVVAYAERGQGGVVMTNSDNGDPLVLEILNGIADVYEWPGYIQERAVADVDPAVYERYDGEYVVNDALTITVRRDGARLMAAATGFGESELLPESDRTFFAEQLPVEITFVIGQSGAADAIDVKAFGAELRGMRRRSQ